MQVPYQDKDINEGNRAHELILQNIEFHLSRFGQDNTQPIEDTISDWINDGSIIFIWYQGYQHKAHLSNTNDKYYDQRSYPKNRRIPNERCPWRFNINSACTVCMKTW